MIKKFWWWWGLSDSGDLKTMADFNTNVTSFHSCYWDVIKTEHIIHLAFYFPKDGIRIFVSKSDR